MSLLNDSGTERVVSYVPEWVRRSLAAAPEQGAALAAECQAAAVMFADISGFTPLAERLAQKGAVGAEELTAILNAYFGRLTELIAAHGGEITKYAGDAMLVLWPVFGESLGMAVHRAAACGLDIQRQLSLYQVDAQTTLSIKIGIGAGDILVAGVGGVRDRWELLVAGDPILQIAAAEKGAKPGEVILSAAAVQAISEAELESSMDRAGRPTKMGTGRSSELSHSPAKKVVSGEKASGGQASSGGLAGDKLSDGTLRLTALKRSWPLQAAVQSDVPSHGLPAIRSYVPSTVLARLDAGLGAWLSELRRLTILFVKVTGIDYESVAAVATVQAAVVDMQKALYRYDGSMNQFIVDDKGTIFLAVMGVPPKAHLVRLLAQKAAGTPFLLALEDLQWLDSSSWDLLRRLQARVPEIFILATLRPFSKQAPAVYTQLRALPETKQLLLTQLSAAETALVAQAELGVKQLPDSLLRFIVGRADGNPFFSLELLYALRDQGLIRVVGDQLEVAVSAKELQRLDFPDHIQGVVTSRIDRLGVVTSRIDRLGAAPRLSSLGRPRRKLLA